MDFINEAKAGRAIPFKFSVATQGGTPVIDLTAALVTVTSYPCDSDPLPGDPLECYATGGSGLQNFGDGSYQVNVQSSKDWRGCFYLGIVINGASQVAQFQFR
jgi:hypothetical protein